MALWKWDIHIQIQQQQAFQQGATDANSLPQEDYVHVHWGLGGFPGKGRIMYIAVPPRRGEGASFALQMESNVMPLMLQE